MSRIAIAAALIAAGWSASAGMANADPAPPPAPKTTIDGDGTYAVGKALTKKSQSVQIDPTDTAFTTNDCQPWQKTDAAPPPPPSPGDLLGQLGSFIGRGILTGGG